MALRAPQGRPATLPPALHRNPQQRAKCIYFARGYCQNGDSCRFEHGAPPGPTKQVCAHAIPTPAQMLFLRVCSVYWASCFNHKLAPISTVAALIAANQHASRTVYIAAPCAGESCHCSPAKVVSRPCQGLRGPRPPPSPAGGSGAQDRRRDSSGGFLVSKTSVRTLAARELASMISLRCCR